MQEPKHMSEFIDKNKLCLHVSLLITHFKDDQAPHGFLS